MVQTITTRNHDRSAPGFMVTPAQERETSTMCLPTVAQELTLTLGGADPSVAGNYNITIPLPSGGDYTFTWTTVGGIALALEGPNLAAAINTDVVLGKLYSASAVGAVVTIVATSPQISIPAADFAIVVPGGTTIVAAQTVAAGGASLRMGVLCRRDATAASGPAINGTYREAIDGPAERLVAGTTLANIRGMVAREANSTELSATFIETNPDQYTAPDIFPVLLRGVGCFVIDPASAAITTATAALYAVIEGGGGGTIPGAITTDATGNVQVWGGGADFLRPVAGEETPAFGQPQQRLLRAKINQTN